MPLLIDGNNVLHSPMPPNLAGLDERGLCRALTTSGLAAKVRGAAVVCDGLARGAQPDDESGEVVALVFAGVGRSADDLIAARIDRDTAPRRLIVVSDDRAIQRHAQRRGAIVWTCAVFVHELLVALAAGGQHDGPAGKVQPDVLSDAEVKRWAREFGVQP